MRVVSSPSSASRQLAPPALRRRASMSADSASGSYESTARAPMQKNNSGRHRVDASPANGLTTSMQLMTPLRQASPSELCNQILKLCAVAVANIDVTLATFPDSVTTQVVSSTPVQSQRAAFAPLVNLRGTSSSFPSSKVLPTAAADACVISLLPSRPSHLSATAPAFRVVRIPGVNC